MSLIRHRGGREPEQLSRLARIKPPEMTTLAFPAVMLVVLGAALYAGQTVLALAVIGISIVSAVVINLGLSRSAFGCCWLAAFTVSWDGVSVGGVRPGDLLLLLSLIMLAASCAHRPLPRMPIYFWLMFVGVVFTGALHVLFPTDPAYLRGRIVVNAVGLPSHTMGTNLGSMTRFLVSVGAVPLVFVLSAFTDRLGFTSFEILPPASVAAPLRTSGFTEFGNALSAVCVVAIAIPIWMVLAHHGRLRFLGVGLIVGMVLGIYSAGSRGGAVCVLVTVIAVFLLLPEYGRRPAALATAGFVLVGALLFLVSSLGTALLHSLRLVGSSNAADSDMVRATVGVQGYRDFAHSPIDGIGLQVVFEAHNVYLQALASGGIVLFVCLAAMLLGSTYDLFRLRTRTPLAGVLMAGLLGQIAVNFFENMLTNRYMYMGVGLAIGLRAALRFETALPRRPVTPLPVTVDLHHPPTFAPRARSREVSIGNG